MNFSALIAGQDASLAPPERPPERQVAMTYAKTYNPKVFNEK